MKTIRQPRVWLYMLATILASFSTLQARAQSFPDKPVHLIVGVSPGGGTDYAARLLAQHLSKLWGQPVIVENRLGAAGTIAYEYVEKSAPDGYTLLVTSDDMTATSAFRSNLPYNLLRDFTPISLIGTDPAILVVTPSLPVHSVKDLIALAKLKPGKLTYGSAGVGGETHLQAARFAAMAGVNMVHVPYQGVKASDLAVAEGEIDMALGSIASAKSLIDAGKLKMLAITSAERSPLAPSVPTVDESGLPGFTFIDWYGVFAPVKLPPDVLAKIEAGLSTAVNAPDVKEALFKQGILAQTNTPQAFAAMVRDQLEELTKIVKQAGLQAK